MPPVTLVSYSGRGAAAPLDASVAIVGVFWGSWGALLPAIKQNVGASEAVLGRTLFFIALAAVCTMLVAGRIADRTGGRAVAPSLAAFGLACAGPGFADTVGWLTATFVLLGVATGALDVIINTAVAAYEGATGARLMGRVHAWFSAGLLAGALLAGAARDAGASPGPIMIGVALCVLAVAGWCRGTAFPPLAAGRTERPRIRGSLALLGAACGLAFLIEDGMVSWGAIHLEETLGARPFVGGLATAVLAASMVAGRALYQRHGDALPDRTTLAVAGVAAAIAAVVTAGAHGQLVALVGIGLTGAAISLCAPLLFSLAGAIAGGGRQGTAIAGVTSVAYFGFLIGPPLIGGIAGIAGLRIGLGAMSVVALVMASMAAVLPGRTPLRSD